MRILSQQLDSFYIVKINQEYDLILHRHEEIIFADESKRATLFEL